MMRYTANVAKEKDMQMFEREIESMNQVCEIINNRSSVQVKNCPQIRNVS